MARGTGASRPCLPRRPPRTAPRPGYTRPDRLTWTDSARQPARPFRRAFVGTCPAVDDQSRCVAGSVCRSGATADPAENGVPWEVEAEQRRRQGRPAAVPLQHGSSRSRTPVGAPPPPTPIHPADMACSPAGASERRSTSTPQRTPPPRVDEEGSTVSRCGLGVAQSAAPAARGPRQLRFHDVRQPEATRIAVMVNSWGKNQAHFEPKPPLRRRRRRAPAS